MVKEDVGRGRIDATDPNGYSRGSTDADTERFEAAEPDAWSSATPQCTMSTLLISLLIGCTNTPAAQCASGADDSTLEATIDGEDWLGEGLTWLWSGDSVQLTTTGTDRITAVGHRDADGASISALTDSLPITVSLDDDAGWAVLYEGNESARSVSGELILTEYTEGDTLAGCIVFDTDSGTSIEDGVFRADYAGD
jgi:hypothetical protein